MSLHNFQLAFAKLVASPQLCVAVREDGSSFFSGFDLNEKEISRLRSVVNQKGMQACCNLYRMNRVTPLYTQLSNTCTMLEERLMPEVEAFWNHYKDTSLQFREEVLAFGEFLMNRIDDGIVQIPYLKDILNFEIAINALSYLPEGHQRFVRFEYDIYRLLYLLSIGKLHESSIERSNTLYKLYLVERVLQMEEVRRFRVGSRFNV